MRAAVLFSGGKDSTLALHEAMRSGHEIKYLVSLFPESRESYMFHYPNVRLTEKQAASMGIPIITKTTPGEKERELQDLENLLLSVKGEIEAVVSGALASRYQKSRVDRICGKLGLESVAPLWHRDPSELWEACLREGFKVMITGVACDGLGKEWLGRIIDRKGLDELKMLSRKHRFHLGGEGGEFETIVLDGPMFKKPLKLKKTGIEWDEETNSGFLSVTTQD